MSATNPGSTIMLHDINAEALARVADTAQAFVKERRLSTRHQPQALLVNPVTNRVRDVVELLDHMIRLQPQWLGYLP